MRPLSWLFAAIAFVAVMTGSRDSFRAPGPTTRNQGPPFALTERQRGFVGLCVTLWMIHITVVSLGTAFIFHSPNLKGMVLLIFVVLSAGFMVVGGSALPWRDLTPASQYQRIKHLRALTGVQGVIGGVGCALILGFEHSPAAEDLAIGIFLWTAAAVFHFAFLWAQIRMETSRLPPHRSPAPPN